MNVRHAALLAAAIGCTPAAAFSFLCNGVDASGTRELTDFCGDMNNNGREDAGDCTANNAARWTALQADFRFDDATRPSEETLAEWQSHQTATIAAWNNVQGHTLTLRDAGAASFRVFGGNDNGENSIFWVTSLAEFNNKVGGGSNSILGVTLAPYSCGNGSVRGGIVDADIIMNGTGAFDWDDNSVVSTMVHEVGHAIGFGHPCTDCADTAIMSATSGFNDSDVPLFDDQEAIRALYPGTPGGLGTSCSTDNDCDSGPCVTVDISGESRRFCSQTCGTCDDGFVCTNVAGEGNVCVFSNASIAEPGDACGPPGCVDECAGTVGPGCNLCINTGNGDVCAAACNPTSGAGCAGDTECAAFGCNTAADCGSGQCTNGACTAIGVCIQGGTALRGQACDGSTACVDDLSCITDANGNNGTCLGLCDDSAAGCLSTESCLFLFGNTTQGACIPAGSGTEGDACADFDECGRGLICLGGTCAQRCDNGFSCSDETQSCVAIGGGGGMRSCVDATGEGESEGEGEGEGEPDCLVERGNFDCPAGASCDDGACVRGGEGPVGTFGLCDADDDCSGGLCVNGVCSRPCDVGDGCPDAYTCDAAAIEGGLCVPDSCLDNADICGDDFGCTYSSAQRNVCAKGVTPTVCGCDSSGTSTPAAPLVALLFVGALDGARRRRHRRGEQQEN
jgi:hypothetical protein